MALTFHPEPGTILICDFQRARVHPEMDKQRPVVVVSPRLKHRHGLIAVVPLSTTPPDKPQDFNCTLTFDPPLPEPFDSPEMWVKGDMVMVASFERLALIRTGRDHTGRRKYLMRKLEPDQLRRVYLCVLHGLGLSALTAYL